MLPGDSVVEAGGMLSLSILKLHFVLCRLSEGDFYLARIAVSPKERKRGLAGTMLADLFDRAKAAGATRVVLEVDKNDEATRRLYAKHGFEEVGVRRVTHEERALEYIHLQRTIVTN